MRIKSFLYSNCVDKNKYFAETDELEYKANIQIKKQL